MKNILIKQSLFIGMAFLLTSCHSRYIYLDYEVHYGPTWNSEHDCIAFVASKTAFRSATGIARFPDGGLSEYLLKDVGLYVFYPESNQLIQMINFYDQIGLLGTSRLNWDIEIALKNIKTNSWENLFQLR